MCTRLLECSAEAESINRAHSTQLDIVAGEGARCTADPSDLRAFNRAVAQHAREVMLAPSTPGTVK